MSIQDFPNGISSGGIPLYGSNFCISGPGKHYFVDSVAGSDGNTGKTWKKAKKSIKAAYALTTSGNNDVVHVLGCGTAYTNTTVLDFANAYTHVVGEASPIYSGGRARITNTYTGATAGEYTISSVGSIFQNLHWQHGASATATSVVGVALSGDGRNAFIGCNFEGPTDATVAGGTAIKPLMLTSTQDNSFYHCTFGGRTILSASAAGAMVHFAGSNNNANTFEKCLFLHYNSTTTSAIISYVDGAMADSGYTLFNDCIFHGAANVNVADVIRYTTAGHGCTILKDCALTGLGMATWATGAWKTHIDVSNSAGAATGGLGGHPA